MSSIKWNALIPVSPKGSDKAFFSDEISKPDKLSAEDAIQMVFENLGGVKNMQDWAESHPTLFYTKLYPKLLQKKSANNLADKPSTIESLLFSLDKSKETCKPD